MSGHHEAGGVGGASSFTLSSIGSDLSVSVSFSIARELLEAAGEQNVSTDELVGIVLGFAIVLTACKERFTGWLETRAEEAPKRALEKFKASDVAKNLASSSEVEYNDFRDRAVAEELRKQKSERTFADFAFMLLSIAQRIAVAISVQLLAASVRDTTPSRLVRTISLIALATFFVLLESFTSRTFF